MMLLNPLALLLLLPLAGSALWFVHPRSIAISRLPGNWQQLITPVLREYLGRNLANSKGGSARVAAICALLAIVSLAHPVIVTDHNPPQNFKARVLVLDMSADTEIEPQRFFVESLLRENTSTVQAGPTATGLVLVSDGAYSVVPITNDMAHIQRYLNAAAPDLMPQNGRALHEGIAMAESMLSEISVSAGQVVLVTSGTPLDTLIDLPKRDRLREVVVTGIASGDWRTFSQWYGAQLYTGEQATAVDKRLQSTVSDSLLRGLQSASTDLRPFLLALALVLWLWLFRRRTRV